MDPPITQPLMFSEVEQAKSRCISLQDVILNSLPTSKLSRHVKLTLLRLLCAELRFLQRHPPPSTPITSNVVYFEAIVRVLLHPAVRNASRLCKPVHSTSAYVDIVCTFGCIPAWFIVSARNPALSCWIGGFLSSAERTLLAARSVPVALRPASVFIVFSRGINDDAASTICRHLGVDEIDAHAGRFMFDDLEDGWIGVSSWVMEASRWFEFKIEGENDGTGNQIPILESMRNGDEINLGRDMFGDLIWSLRQGREDTVDLINFDTTSLIAMVSGISNGAAERLLRAPEGEMRMRFKGNYMFVIAQVLH